MRRREERGSMCMGEKREGEGEHAEGRERERAWR